MTGFPAISLPPGSSTRAMQPPFTSGRRRTLPKSKAAPRQGIPDYSCQGGRELMTETRFIAIITDYYRPLPPKPEDYTGRGRAFILRQMPYAQRSLLSRRATAQWFGRDRHPTDCDCQRAAREGTASRREADSSHLETVERT